AQLCDRLDGRGRPEALQPQVEVALHAVLERHGTTLVLASRVFGARAEVPRGEILAWILRGETRHIRRIDDDRALLFEDGDRIGHRLGLFGVQTSTSRRDGRRRADALRLSG